MEVKTVVWCLFVLLLEALSGARAAEIAKYFKEGGNIVLEPKVAVQITNILWKHNGNLLAEWIEGKVELTYYSTFLDRTSLDIKTGRLEITKMSISDAGAYTLEINNNVHGESFAAKAIKKVPKPSVWIQPVACTSDSVSCTMVCEGREPGGTPEDTTEAEPIDYSWKQDGDVWRPSGKTLEINKDTSAIMAFSCQMKNPVSTEESQPLNNPFYKPTPTPPPPSSPVIGITVAVVLLISLAVLGGVGYYKREAIKALLNRRGANTTPNANGDSKADGANEPLSGSTKEGDVTIPMSDNSKANDPLTENLDEEYLKTDDEYGKAHGKAGEAHGEAYGKAGEAHGETEYVVAYGEADADPDPEYA